MHSQREQSKFWVLMTNLKKSVVSMQNMWKGEVQSTKNWILEFIHRYGSNTPSVCESNKRI